MLENSNDITRDRWKTRRRMAWFAFIFVVAIPFFLSTMDNNQISAASGIIIAAFAFCGTIVTAYIGFATQDDIATKSNQK